MSAQFSLLYGLKLTAPRTSNEAWTGVIRVAWAGQEKRLAADGPTGEDVVAQLNLAAAAYVAAQGWPPIR